MFGRILVKSIALIANLVVVLLLFTALLATVVSPEKILLPAYTTLVFPFLVIFNIGFVLFWAIVRKWYFLISLAALIYSAPQISLYIPIHFGQTINTDSLPHITVMSYNVMLNGMLEKDTDENPNKVIRLIRDENADILCLQEFSVSPDKKYMTEKDIRKAFADYPFSHITYKYRSDWSLVGVATFSKFPIVRKDSVHFDSDYNLCHYSDIIIDGDTLRFVNLHLESNRLTHQDKLMPMELKDNFNTEKLSGTTMHLSRKLGGAYRIRAVQADSVESMIRRSDFKTIVCGDFNDLPLSYAYSKIRGTMLDAYAQTGFGPGYTYNETIFRFRIDHIFCDSSFEIYDCEIIKNKASDHFPVVAKIKI
ncbi:MAG: endonuclease/exonuclease/phosphatase family protein [Paludibacteraceae bacterium]|nr:endonuclease/exonuclease/phosphatase family protein [Paludibacteraceae bacterium]